MDRVGGHYARVLNLSRLGLNVSESAMIVTSYSVSNVGLKCHLAFQLALELP